MTQDWHCPTGNGKSTPSPTQCHGVWDWQLVKHSTREGYKIGGRGVTVTHLNVYNSWSEIIPCLKYNMDLCDSQLPLVENEVLNLSDFGHDNEGMF